MSRIFVGLAALVLLAFPAFAQAPQSVRICTGSQCVMVSDTNPLPVTSTGGGGGGPPAASPVTTSGCSVGTASALCVPASTATTWIQLQNTSAAETIACAWGGTAVLNSPTSFQLTAGQSASWGPNTYGVPTNALNCIASAASAPLYVEYR